jgi:hypothetical protein
VTEARAAPAFASSAPALTRAAPGAEDDPAWPRTDGSPVDCREKLRILRQNQAELAQTLRDCFDDAVLMGVDAEAMRGILHAMVAALRDPRMTGPGRR